MIPQVLHQRLLLELHDGHLGICQMKALALSYIWWPGMDKEIEKMAAQCEACKNIAALPPTAPYHPWPCPAAPWDRVHIDFRKFNKQNFLVVVDAYSKWPEVRYMSSTTQLKCSMIFLQLMDSHEYWYRTMALNSQQMYFRNTCTAITYFITATIQQPMVWLK